MRDRLAPVAGLIRANPRYCCYLLARLLSTVETSSFAALLSAALAGYGGGAADVGQAMAVTLVAGMAGMLIAGVLADRMRHLTIVALCQGLRSATFALTAALVLTDTATVPALVGLAVLAGAAAWMQTPALQNLVPDIVTQASLTQAHGVAQIMSSASATLAQAATSSILILAGPGWTFGALTATGLLSTIVFALLRTVTVPPAPPAAAAPITITRVRHVTRIWLDDLLAGWRVIAARPWLWTLTALTAVRRAGWGTAVLVLGPLLATQHLEGALTSWGLVTAAISVGVTCGCLLITLAPASRVGVLLCGAALADALFIATMAADLPVALICAAAFLCGTVSCVDLVLWTSFLQRALPAQQHGRVLAITTVGSNLLIPIVYPYAGPLTDAFGLAAVYTGLAAAIVLGAGLALGAARTCPDHAGAFSPDCTEAGASVVGRSSRPAAG
ncbi:MFS transporter [Nonomuraea sp. NPDC046802]|uniref:MFS transporter n=1 Tax=Nonomuraea sp. NPDC046802 TaxID=3154919 RepID=UPI0034102591